MATSLKDEILDAVDIVDVIGERVTLKRKGREYVGLCPFHADKRPSMSVSPTKRIFKCWSCGAGGDVIKFVQLADRVDFREALHTLAQRAGIAMRDGGGSDGAGARQRDRLREVLRWASKHFQRNLRAPQGRAALEYARSRGLTDATIDRFGVGFACDAWDDIVRGAERAAVALSELQQAGLATTSENGRTYDRFRNRLILPICDAQGRCVAFGGRALGDDPAKYLNSPETALFSKSRILYALDLGKAAIQSEREAIVVEGYLDAVLLHQAGIENVVATLGIALTDPHVKLLTPLADRVVMCFDSDEAGVRAADRAVEIALRGKVDVRVALLETGEDPADAVLARGPDALKSLLQSAIGALEFKWKQASAAYRVDDAHGRREAIASFLHFIGTVRGSGGIDPIEQGLLVSRVAELLSLPASEVYDWLTRAKRTARNEASALPPDTSELSAYDDSIRGLPGGLVSAVEELFGLALADAQVFGRVGGTLAACIGYCETWRRFEVVIQSLADENDGYQMRDVLERCDDGELCDLFDRAVRSAGKVEDAREASETAQRRVRDELDLLRRENLRGRLRESVTQTAEADEAFVAALAAARRQDGALGAQERWRGLR